MAPAAERLPYCPATLWCMSPIVWALGFTSVPLAGADRVVSGLLVVVAR
jgi:hypothetical protein